MSRSSFFAAALMSLTLIGGGFAVSAQAEPWNGPYDGRDLPLTDLEVQAKDRTDSSNISSGMSSGMSSGASQGVSITQWNAMGYGSATHNSANHDPRKCDICSH